MTREMTKILDTKIMDVAVVGAGLAGLQCARRLAEAGFSVVLLDRKVRLTEGIHTTGIFVRRTFEDFEFPAGTLGPRVRRIALYSPGRRRLDLESPRDEFRVGKMGPLYEQSLAMAVAAGVSWRPETIVLKLSGGPGDMRVKFSSPAGEGELICRFVIGADGANSRVARELGLEENRRFIVGVEEVFPSANPGSVPVFHCYLDPKLAPGYLAWVVDDGEEVHVGTGGEASRFEPHGALAEFKNSVVSQFSFPPGQMIEKRGGRIPVGGVLTRIANERGLLVGDAAGAVSPLTAGGLDPCLRMAKLAARVTTEFLRSGNSAHLRSYDGRRFRTRFISRLWMRRMIDAIHSPAVLELICAMLRTPPGLTLASHVFFGRGSFPDLELLEV